MNNRIPEPQVSFGPSLLAAYKTVTVNYNKLIFSNSLTVSSEQLAKLSRLLPKIIQQQLPNDGLDNTDALLVALIKSLLNSKGDLNLRIEVQTSVDGAHQLCIEYLNELPAIMVARVSFALVSYVKGSYEKPPLELSQHLNGVLHNLNLFTPGQLIQEMLFAAKRQKVPYFILDYSATLISYGQGSRSVLFNLASSEFDSNIGFNLQKDKLQTNAFLKILGYPATDQKLASSYELCCGVIQQMGFPVVIKPVSAGQGKGVTSNITRIEQVASAFSDASKFSPANVLIEKFIVGDEHRITVSQGKVNGIGCRQPAAVIGDGENNIQELISIENNLRKEPSRKQFSIKDIDIDDTLIQVLKNAQLDLDSIPVDGQQINLQSISNLSTGGTVTIIEEEDIHPDILEMALDITQAFRLDSVGLDFITPDISRSWRDVGTIIEINTFPMLSPRLADSLIKNQFSTNNNGRIPSTLIVTNDPAFSQQIVEAKQSENLIMGYTDENSTLLNTSERTSVRKGLYQRCLSLLINPSCEAIVVAISTEEIIKNGLPMDYFDHCIIDSSSNFQDETITIAVKNTTQAKDLEQWLKNYVGLLEIH